MIQKVHKFNLYPPSGDVLASWRSGEQYTPAEQDLIDSISSSVDSDILKYLEKIRRNPSKYEYNRGQLLLIHELELKIRLKLEGDWGYAIFPALSAGYAFSANGDREKARSLFQYWNLYWLRKCKSDLDVFDRHAKLADLLINTGFLNDSLMIATGLYDRFFTNSVYRNNLEIAKLLLKLLYKLNYKKLFNNVQIHILKNIPCNDIELYSELLYINFRKLSGGNIEYVYIFIRIVEKYISEYDVNLMKSKERADFIIKLSRQYINAKLFVNEILEEQIDIKIRVFLDCSSKKGFLESYSLFRFLFDWKKYNEARIIFESEKFEIPLNSGSKTWSGSRIRLELSEYYLVVKDYRLCGEMSIGLFDAFIDREEWMRDKVHRPIGEAYIIRCIYLILNLIREGIGIEWKSSCIRFNTLILGAYFSSDPEDAPLSLIPFREFHGNWLKLCIADGAAEEVPHVLSAVQGREMAAMLLAELEASEADYPEGDPRKLYLEVVRELRQLRLMLRSAEKREEMGSGFDGGFDDGSRRFKADAETALRLDEQRRANTDRLRERYAALMEELNRLRGEIAELDTTFAMAYRPPDVSVERLSGGMAVNEAKVLLFMHAQEDGVDPVPHACCITADGKAEVLVLDRMPAAREALSSAGLRGMARMGMRGGRGAAPLPKQDAEEAPGEGDALLEEQQADLAALMGEALWQPLRAKYPQVTNWHLATHQDLHVLPVGLGIDPAHTMTVHPGLLFLARKQDRSVNSNVPMRLAMHSDPADGTEQAIPFVAAEVALAQLVWGEDRVAVSAGEETLERLNAAEPPLDALLLAAHGDELDSDPPQTIVWLDRAGERMLDTTAVLSASQRPPVVIASACVAGRVREDSLGEPLGLVSAFFLKGARFVLAPLQPIQDLQAPLVMGLFHRAWKETGDPHRAWQVARGQALSGQWPGGYEKQVAAAYGPVMRAMLERAVKDDDYVNSVILRSGWNIEPADRAGLMTFEDDDQATIDKREVLIDRLVTEGVGQVLAERTMAARGNPSAAIQHICNWTMPFGR